MSVEEELGGVIVIGRSGGHCHRTIVALLALTRTDGAWRRSRNPSTGENKLYGEYLIDAQVSSPSSASP